LSLSINSPNVSILVRKNVSHDVQWIALPDWQSTNQPTCWKRRHYRSNRQALKMNDQTCRQICRNIQPESGISLVVNPLSTTSTGSHRCFFSRLGDAH
jgi:hypothetical protein